jgi:succinate dehydrogenase / fumarate reductase membrane anchor subunit
MPQFRTPGARVAGLGSAKSGVGHWWGQRVTSIALIPLTILALFPLARNIGEPLALVRERLADPWSAIVLILFIAVTFQHLKQGLQVVIEDYVHAEPWRTGLLLGNVGLCWLFGLTGVFAAARLSFGV